MNDSIGRNLNVFYRSIPLNFQWLNKFQQLRQTPRSDSIAYNRTSVLLLLCQQTGGFAVTRKVPIA
jgi:hypothetical protein